MIRPDAIMTDPLPIPDPPKTPPQSSNYGDDTDSDKVHPLSSIPRTNYSSQTPRRLIFDINVSPPSMPDTPNSSRNGSLTLPDPSSATSTTSTLSPFSAETPRDGESFRNPFSYQTTVYAPGSLAPAKSVRSFRMKKYIYIS